MLACRNIEWDAVEAPSQMQEKWVYDKKTFDSFAKHWETNQPVPPELFERIRAARTYRKGESTHSSLQHANTHCSAPAGCGVLNAGTPGPRCIGVTRARWSRSYAGVQQPTPCADLTIPNVLVLCRQLLHVSVDAGHH